MEAGISDTAQSINSLWKLHCILCVRLSGSLLYVLLKLSGCDCSVRKSSISYLVLTIMKPEPLPTTPISLFPFLPLHVQDAFLINGRRMDGLTEGPDNNGWSTGHKCSYWGDLWASAHCRLSGNRWDDFSKLWTDDSERKKKLFLLLKPIIYLSDVLGGSHFKKCTQETTRWP